MRVIFLIFMFFVSSLRADEIKFDFTDANNLTYNIELMEIFNGKLRLSPTGFWTNTGAPKTMMYTTYLFQSSRKDLFLSRFSPSSSYSLLKSTNYGATWTNINSTPFLNMIELSNHSLCLAPEINLAYGSASLLKSTNNGNTWYSITSPNMRNGCIFKEKDETLYFWRGGRGGGGMPPDTLYLIKSTNKGATWNTVYSNSTNATVPRSMMELNNGDLICCGGNLLLGQGICISHNKGTNWSLISSSSNLAACNKLLRLKDDLTIYAYGYNGIIRSRNDGQTWEPVSLEPGSALIESSEGILYMTSSSNLWKSFDQGFTWQRTPDLMVGSTNYFFPYGALIEADNGKIYLGAGTFLSQFPWELNCLFYNRYPIMAQAELCYAPAYVKQWLTYSKSDSLNGGNIIYEMAYSSDGGSTWSAWMSLTGLDLQKINCKNNGSDHLKVRATLYSLDHNQTPEIDWFSLEFDGSHLTTIKNAVIAPNPFRPYKSNVDYVILYNLPKNFEMKVFSSTGHEVASVNGTSEAMKYKWDVKNNKGEPLKSGVYFCYIKDESGNEKILKFVVLK